MPKHLKTPATQKKQNSPKTRWKTTKYNFYTAKLQHPGRINIPPLIIKQNNFKVDQNVQIIPQNNGIFIPNQQISETVNKICQYFGNQQNQSTIAGKTLTQHKEEFIQDIRDMDDDLKAAANFLNKLLQN